MFFKCLKISNFPDRHLLYGVILLSGSVRKKYILFGNTAFCNICELPSAFYLHEFDTIS